jgi:hypothetical protein
MSSMKMMTKRQSMLSPSHGSSADTRPASIFKLYIYIYFNIYIYIERERHTPEQYSTYVFHENDDQEAEYVLSLNNYHSTGAGDAAYQHGVLLEEVKV